MGCHQPGLEEQNKVADLAERRVSVGANESEYYRKQAQLVCHGESFKVVADSEYKNEDAMKRFEQECERLNEKKAS